MNLDWNFYYDDWLIDKVPDGLEIKVVDRGNGPECVPSSLTCYFGANPIYLYGEGKLWHESLISPRGVAIFPEFLQRPGFEWIDRKSFEIDFSSTTDFFDRNVVAMHTGRVDATRYISDVLNTMYGLPHNDFSNVKTASSTLRLMNSDDFRLIEKGVSSLHLYGNSQEMIDDKCILYSRMFIENGRPGPMDLISGSDLIATTPGAPILIPGSFTRVLFLKYSHITIPESQAHSMFQNDSWTLIFRTLANFREGTLLDFGSTRYTDDPNYGAKVSIMVNHMDIVLNDGGRPNTYSFPLNIDFRFAHSWAITREGGVLSLSINGNLVSTHDVSTLGSVQYLSEFKNYISRTSVGEKSQYTGDIEELAMFSARMNPDKAEKFLEGRVPIMKKGGAAALDAENIPHALSYGLTFSKPSDFYIPNYFNADFFKFYLKDKTDLVLVATTDSEKISSSYRDDLEPFKDKSILMPVGFNVDQVLAKEDGILSEEVPVLTKLTSDTHIPLRIHMDFIVPTEFYDKDIVYNMRIVLKSLHRFLWYSFKKYKTGEFV